MFSGPKTSGDSAAIKQSSAPSKKQQLQQGLQGSNAAAAAGQGQQAGMPAGIRVRERKFENGDRYRGGWLNGLPEGEGKYEWSDGSGYEGGWKAGHKHGVGKYTWNSGASYQGEWSNGFMHGVGTFEAPDGSKYQGGWKEDLKHGLGRKIYANGDVYEGLWSTGKPDGPGRYIWVDFNEYDGAWRAGRLHGQGTFVWKTGERYDGEWKAGQEDGVGMFTFRDGSTFEGFWHRGKKHGVGIFRPAAAPAASAMRSLKGRFDSGGPSRGSSASQGASTGRSAFADATAAAAAMPDEAAADYFQNKQAAKPAAVTEPTTGEGQQQPRMSHQLGSAKSMSSMGQHDHGSMAGAHKSHSRKDQVMLKEYNEGRLVRQQVLSPTDIATISSALCAPPDMVALFNSAQGGDSSRRSRSSRQQQATALGDVVYKEHSAYDLMVQLQVGIRWSVTSAALDYTSPASLRSELQPPDYATTITQEFPRAGSRSTPVHPAADFVWKDYAPSAFRMLREAASVEQHDFINQLCGDQALRLLQPPGNSDAMFFLSSDERFIVRTITLAEKKMLLSVLQQYAEHIRRYPKSLLTRFFGLHRVSAAAGGMGKKVRFLVMGNIFATQLPIQLRYDLKGCTKGRTVGAAAKGHSAQTVWKDLNLRQRFKLQEGSARRVHEQLDVDTRLLSSIRVMDYSMLLGVHHVAAAAAVGSEGRQARSQSNFAEHSNAPGLSAAVSRLENQLSRTKLDKWAQAALHQLACANLLMGLAAAGGKSIDSSRRGSITRSPTLVLATRPRRIRSSRKGPSALQPAAAAAAAAEAAIKAAGAGAEAGISDDAAVKDSSSAAAAVAVDLDSKAGSDIMQPLGQGVAALTMPLRGGEQQEVTLYFGVIDILQGYTMKKRLESYLRRLVSSAHAISAVSPSFYAGRFRKQMKKVLL